MYSILIVAIAIWLVAASYSTVLPGRVGDRRVGFLALALAFMAFYQAGILFWASGLAPALAAPSLVGLSSLLVASVALLAVFSLDRVLVEQGRTQRDLRERESMYRTLAELSPAGIFQGDPSGRCAFMNQRWHDITGQRPEEALGRGWMDSVHPYDRQHTIDVFETGKREGHSLMRCEFRLLHPHRGPVWAMWQLMAMRAEHGEVTGYIGTITDISELKRVEKQLEEAREQLQERVEERTAHLVAANRALEAENAERRKAEDRLRLSEDRLRAILDKTTAVIYLKDRDGRYLLVNRRYEELFHVTDTEIQGKIDHDLFPREAADAFRENDLKVIQANAALEFDETVPHDDGLHQYISIKFPLHDASGDPWAVCGISTDISDRVRAQQERDRIFNLSRDLMCTGGFDGRVGECNPAFEATLGYRPEELRARHFAELMHPDDVKKGMAGFDEVMAGAPLDDFEVRWRCKDGSYKWLSWKVVPVMTEGKTYSVGRDVTARKSTEETMHKHREQIADLLRVHTMGELASQIAHELNQPLSAIASYANGAVMRLEAGGAQTAEVVAVIRKIAEQAMEAGALIHRIRQFATKGGIQLEPVDLNKLAEAAVALLKPATERRVEFQLELEPSLPEIEVDGAQIEQVMVNLIRNGVEAMEAGGEGSRLLSIRTSRAGPDHVEFEVRDAGVGLPPGRLGHIFEPFFTTKPSGLGMGLAISRTIMEAHGGRLWASRNPNGGATFRGMIPIRQASS